MLAPRQIAEPGGGPVTQLSGFREVAKKRRRPLLQPITVQPKPALATADGHIAGDHRGRYPVLCGDQPVSIALPQPKSGKDDALWSGESDQLAQNQCGERHHVETLARDCGYPLERFARLPTRSEERRVGKESRTGG